MLDIDYKYIDELFDLKKIDFEFEYKSTDYHRLHELLDGKYNISGYNFSFDYCCSNLIRKLFEKYVTEETILIMSARDHTSIHECLKDFPTKETIRLDDGKYMKDGVITSPRLTRTNEKDLSLAKLQMRLMNRDYKNILFLSYGSNVCDGTVRDNRFFERVFKICDDNCKNTIKVLDDCQGSMWIDRDYSIFDYILWTGHATLSMFDIGILISKENMPTIGDYHYGEEYLYHNYRQLLKNEEFASSWNHFLTKATGVHLSDAPHIFNLKLTKDYPEKYFIETQLNQRNISDPLSIRIESNRYILLRVEMYMGETGKYWLLRSLHFIMKEREFIEA